MTSARQKALALIEQHGADFKDWGDGRQLLGDVWAPPGRVWAATSTHVLALNFHTDRPAGWKFLAAELARGVEPCQQPECETCTGGAKNGG